MTTRTKLQSIALLILCTPFGLAFAQSTTPNVSVFNLSLAAAADKTYFPSSVVLQLNPVQSELDTLNQLGLPSLGDSKEKSNPDFR